VTGRATVLTADTVLTVDPARPRAEAVLVVDGTIAAVGAREEVLAGAGGAERVHLPGATIVPGLVESHVHPIYTGLAAGWADCRTPPCASISEMQEALRAHAIGDGGWLRGWGYDDTLLAEGRHPTRDDLDAVSTTSPVVVVHTSAHFAVANTVALRAAGLDEDTVAHGDQRFPRGADGRLTGLLWEIDAVARVLDRIPTPSREQLRAALLDTLAAAAGRGITTVHDLGIGLSAGADELAVYRDADEAGELPVHVVGYLRGDLAGDDEDYASVGSRFRLAGAKFWADGSIQGLSAALRLPYTCRPDHCGELLHPEETLREMCEKAAAAGAQVAVHANGDAAVAAAIRVLGPLQATRPPGAAPHRIEHCQVATPGDHDAIRATGLGVSFFVNHVHYWGDRHRRMFLGADRAADIDALAWADARGQRFGLHSDCPITPMDPLRTIWSAVSRRTSGGDVLGPHQRLDVHRALQAMTADSAWLSGDERRVGRITAGRRADLVAVDTDLAAADPDALRAARAVAVMVDGRWAVRP
jgi:predicted amidohydrolase YtcJ